MYPAYLLKSRNEKYELYPLFFHETSPSHAPLSSHEALDDICLIRERVACQGDTEASEETLDHLHSVPPSSCMGILSLSSMM